MTAVLIIAPFADRHIRPVTYELISAARQILGLISDGRAVPAAPEQMIRIAVLHPDPEIPARTIAAQTGLPTDGIRTAGFEPDTSETHIHCLEWLMQRVKPSTVIAAHTSQARGFVPGLAVRTASVALSGVQAVRSDPEGIVFLRSVHSNTMRLPVIPGKGQPVIMTVFPGTFGPCRPQQGPSGPVAVLDPPPRPGRSPKISTDRIIERHRIDSSLEEARVIVSAGRGIQEKEHLGDVFKLASHFPAAAVGASRPLVDAGWIGYGHQVGITGAAVSPELYIACGISGSSQHLAGMKDSGLIVSINSNPDAPICRYSDICIRADAAAFVKKMLEKLCRSGTRPADPAKHEG